MPRSTSSPLSRSRRAPERRARAVIVWTAVSFCLTQVLVMSLPGYPWPSVTEPEAAVQTDRFQRGGGWLRTIPTLEESIIQWQVHHLLTAVPPQDVLFVGDSSCLMGVMPEVITQATGLNTWNLATVGSLSTQGQADILELYLKKHPTPRPKLVVCYLAPPTLARDRDETERQGVYNGFREWLYGADAGLVAQLPLAQLPGYRLRRPLYEAANQLPWNKHSTLLVHQPRGQIPSDEEVRRTLLTRRGYFSEPRRQRLPAIASDGNRLPLTADGLRGIVRMLETAQAHSIDLVFMLTPAPERYRNPQHDAAYRDLAAHFMTAARPYPRVTIQSPLLRYFDDASFGTAHHMTMSGAARNSAEIARLITAVVS